MPTRNGEKTDGDLLHMVFLRFLAADYMGICDGFYKIHLEN